MRFSSMYHYTSMCTCTPMCTCRYALLHVLDANFLLSSLTYTTACVILFGLVEVAIAMSDPFGDDEVDFDLDALMQKAYKDAVAMLSVVHAPAGDTLHSDLRANPIARSMQIRRNSIATRDQGYAASPRALGSQPNPPRRLPSPTGPLAMKLAQRSAQRARASPKEADHSAGHRAHATQQHGAGGKGSPGLTSSSAAEIGRMLRDLGVPGAEVVAATSKSALLELARDYQISEVPDAWSIQVIREEVQARKQERLQAKLSGRRA